MKKRGGEALSYAASEMGAAASPWVESAPFEEGILLLPVEP